MPKFEVEMNDGRKFEVEADTQPTPEEVMQYIGGNEQQSKNDSVLGDVPFSSESGGGNVGKSPLTNLERMTLSFADDAGREKYLKSKFQIVERLDNGKFAVGDNPNEVTPIDPEGMFNDVIGDLADIVGEIPVFAGQIAGSVAGTLGATPGGGTILGGALGAGAGEVAKKAIGKSLGVNSQDAVSTATDVALTTAFGAAGESIAIGAGLLGQAARKAVVPKVGKLLGKTFNKINSDTGKDVFINTTKKTFNILANVPEKSTETVFKHGIEETLGNPFNRNPKSVLLLADEMFDTIKKSKVKKLSTLTKATDNLISKSGQKVDVQDIYSVMRKDLIDLNILDEAGKYRRNAPVDNATFARQILSDFMGEDKPMARFPETINRQMSVKELLKMQNTLSDKFAKISPKMQSVVVKALNGADDGSTLGVRNTVKEIAKKLGSDDYLNAVDDYNGLLTTLEELTIAKSNPTKIERFIKRLENLPETQLRSLNKLNQSMPDGSRFLDKIEMWNAAQDFASAKPNLLRFGAITAALGKLSGVGFDSNENFAYTLAGAGLLGTPAGLKTLMLAASRTGAIPRTAAGATKKMMQTQTERVVSSALLSRLLQQKSSVGE